MDRKRPLSMRLGAGISALIAPFAPQLALNRDRNLMERQIIGGQASHYNAAGSGSRASDFRRNRTDAIEAGRGERERLSWISRDMLRNNPRAVKLRRTIVGQVVGSGIAPALIGIKGKDRDTVDALIRDHCMTTDFDVDGRLTMRGQQVLAFGAAIGDGEVLIRRRMRTSRDGYALPFQTQVLEADFLNANIDGALTGGNFAEQGIEFDSTGRRVAYHLFESHPGGRRGGMPKTVRVAAENIIHLYRVDRPGQVRGVSWFAPVVTLMHELQKYQEAQVKRQEIAAMFAGKFTAASDPRSANESLGELSPGTIFHLNDGEELDFTDPPSVDGYAEFMQITDQVIASAMLTTYAGLTGDYSKINYTSGRMARIDIDPVIRDLQDNLLIATLCAGYARWIAEAVRDVTDIGLRAGDLFWTPPVRPMVDPTKDYKAAVEAMRAGLKARRATIREIGGDPAKVEDEIAEERRAAETAGLIFTSDAGQDSGRQDQDAPEDTKDMEND